MPDDETERLDAKGDDLSGMKIDSTADADSLANERDRQIMLTFESMGGSVTGCEFGTVQRAFGAEPMGLFRWSGMVIHLLIEVLERRFERIGEPDTTVVTYADSGAPREYGLFNTTFSFGMHAHIYENEMDHDTFYKISCRKLQVMRRKMIADLAKREKIFIIKDSVNVPGEDQIARLYAAMRSYGDNVLLIVAPADADNPHGSLRQLRDGLWLGRMDFSGGYDSQRIQRWLELCTVAVDKFQALAVSAQ